jgi:hypothetical protein
MVQRSWPKEDTRVVKKAKKTAKKRQGKFEKNESQQTRTKEIDNQLNRESITPEFKQGELSYLRAKPKIQNPSRNRTRKHPTCFKPSGSPTLAPTLISACVFGIFLLVQTFN